MIGYYVITRRVPSYHWNSGFSWKSKTGYTHVVTRAFWQPPKIYIYICSTFGPLIFFNGFSKRLHPCHPNQAFHLIPCRRISLSQGVNRLWILDLSQVSQVSPFIPVTGGWRVPSFQNANGSRRCWGFSAFPNGQFWCQTMLRGISEGWSFEESDLLSLKRMEEKTTGGISEPELLLSVLSYVIRSFSKNPLKTLLDHIGSKGSPFLDRRVATPKL